MKSKLSKSLQIPLLFTLWIMKDIFVDVFEEQQKIAERQYSHPQTAAEVKTALAEEDAGWIGTLQKKGSPTVLTGGRGLEAGAAHEFHLQRRQNLRLDIAQGAELVPRVRMWGDRQILVQNIGEKQGVLLSLYLAANESDQTSCGHVLMQQVRHVMHGLPSEVPIMYSKCNVSHNFIPASASGSQLFSTQDDLSEMQFPEHCKLYVWPGMLDHVLEKFHLAYHRVADVVAHMLLLGLHRQSFIKPSKRD
ncbi:TPA: hypothetical protein ACH3X3_008138 [Trebouxia sp. C0006]